MTSRSHPRGAGSHPERGEGKPTVRQIYALCAALCERHGEQFPETFAEASETIERLRIENGHPAPALGDTPPRTRPPGARDARRRYRG